MFHRYIYNRYIVIIIFIHNIIFQIFSLILSHLNKEPINLFTHHSTVRRYLLIMLIIIIL